MAFVDRVRAAFSAFARGSPPDMFSPDALGPIGQGVTGSLPYGQPPVRGSRELIIAGKREPWLFAVNDKISRSVAAVHWNVAVARDKKNGDVSQSKSRYYNDCRRQIFSTYGESTASRKRHMRDLTREANLEIIYNHPLINLLEKPNPLQTGYQFRALLQRHMDLTGEIFCIKERNAFGMPIQLWPVPNFWCKLTPYYRRATFLMAYGMFVQELPDTEVLWLKHLDLENPYARGMGPGFALADVIETYAYALKTEKAFYYNQGMPPVVLGLEGAKQAQLDQIAAGWKDKHGGYWNAMKVAWVNFKVSVAKLGPKFADAEMLAQQNQKRDTIIQIYGVPPEILGITEHSNKSTSVTAKGIFAEQVLVPRLEDLREMLTNQLVPEFGEPGGNALVLEYSSPVPDDRESDITVVGKVPTVLTINEWRGLANFDPRDDGDVLYTPPEAGGGGDPTSPPEKEIKAVRVQRALPAKRGESDVEKAVIKALNDAQTFDSLATELSDCIQEFGDATVKQIAASYKGNLDVDAFNLTNPNVKAYLEDFSGEGIKNIDESTASYLRNFLSTSLESGAGIDDMVDSLMLDSNWAFGEARTENIARTEVLGASNFGTLQGYKQSGVVDTKGWMATPGTKGSRESHEELDGTEIGVDEEFTDNATGACGQHPGGFNDPNSDCNCRCSIYARINDPEEARASGVKLHEPHATIAKRRVKFEVRVQDKARSVLDGQREAVITALRAHVK